MQTEKLKSVEENPLLGFILGDVIYFYDKKLNIFGWQSHALITANRTRLEKNGIIYKAKIYSKNEVNYQLRPTGNKPEFQLESAGKLSELSIGKYKAKYKACTFNFDEQASFADKVKILIKMIYVLDKVFDGSDEINCLEVSTNQKRFEKLLNLLPAAKYARRKDGKNVYYISRSEGCFSLCEMRSRLDKFRLVKKPSHTLSLASN